MGEGDTSGKKRCACDCVKLGGQGREVPSFVLIAFASASPSQAVCVSDRSFIPFNEILLSV